MARELTLLFHFIGFGLLFATTVAGFILERQYKRAKDLPSKATVLRALRPIGLLGPIGAAVQLITGIGNMHALGYGLLDAGWLSAKIVFFAFAVIGGIMFGIKSRKRGALVHAMAQGKAPADAETLLKSHDTQMTLFHVVMPILLFVILYLSIYGRLGGQ